ncbi:sce7725 family protein [Brevibacterium sp. XM4083]|uniref:sce7725 family protein n=1 Tax=Brevibacterium sp. XM4083 TaxID=2583238 RepID=UPI00112EAC38|nr:sce7725 family protein [Brevibacterium sp. XM4083]MCM1012318.1 sce7725 family protein [Brevibacterium sp. XM4083]
MYYPYFRGKQFELMAIRESASLIADSGFVPIIEPVRESLGGLEKALRSLVDAGAKAVVVVNPRHGDHRENSENITGLLEQDYSGNDGVNAGILLTNETSVSRALSLAKTFTAAGTTLIHAGFTESRALSDQLADDAARFRNIFLEDHANRLYRRHFVGKPRILVSDGFVQMKNADYPPVEAFSDLHITYPEEGMDGYGDFLTVGDNYSEGGGPAYAVAIHLTFIDSSQDDAMFVYHFKSETNDTPTDPAGKFAQALSKLIAKLDSRDSHLLETSAITEFRALHDRGHFPGLGYVKKLSIKHHLETLARFHSVDNNG